MRVCVCACVCDGCGERKRKGGERIDDLEPFHLVVFGVFLVVGWVDGLGCVVRGLLLVQHINQHLRCVESKAAPKINQKKMG